MTSKHDSKSPYELPSLSTSLLNRVQQMEPEAWSRLVAVFSPIVYRWARTSGLASADSSDVVQEVFAAVAKNIGTFERQKETASFRSWLATITRNRVRDRIRKNVRIVPAAGGTQAWQRIQEAPDPIVMDSVESDVGQSDELATKISEEQLEESINLGNLECGITRQVVKLVKQNCDEKTWKAFWLTTVEEKSADEVSEELGIGVASVYQAKSRILRRLRERIAELP